MSNQPVLKNEPTPLQVAFGNVIEHIDNEVKFFNDDTDIPNNEQIAVELGRVQSVVNELFNYAQSGNEGDLFKLVRSIRKEYEGKDNRTIAEGSGNTNPSTLLMVTDCE